MLIHTQLLCPATQGTAPSSSHVASGWDLSHLQLLHTSVNNIEAAWAELLRLPWVGTEAWAQLSSPRAHRGLQQQQLKPRFAHNASSCGEEREPVPCSHTSEAASSCPGRTHAAASQPRSGLVPGRGRWLQEPPPRGSREEEEEGCETSTGRAELMLSLRRLRGSPACTKAFSSPSAF